MEYTKRNKIPKNSKIDWSKSDAQIAREIGCHASNICRRRRQAKIAPVTPHKRLAVDWRSQPWETKNDTQIAKALGCSNTQVREKRREYARHLQRPRHTNFAWAGQDWTQHDSQIAKARGLTRGAVSSARSRYSKGIKAPRKPGKRQAEQAQATIYAEERKTLHQWLDQLGTPTHEQTGLRMCLLRRLAVQLGVQPWEAPTP